MRRLAPVALALLLVLSGCSFLGGSATTTGPGTAPPTTGGDAAAVPGVEDGTLTDEAALLSAHREALLATGFETDFGVNATTTYRGNTVDVSRRQQTLSEADAAEYQYRVTNRNAGSQFDYWGNQSVRVVRAQTGSETRYLEQDPAGADVLTGTQVLSRYLEASTFTVAGTETADGTTLVTLTAAGVEDTTGVVPDNATDVRNYQARVVVDTEGRIHRVVITAAYTIDGEDADLRLVYELVRTDGVAVEQPDWAREALSA